jgi:hypothetical protein
MKKFFYSVIACLLISWMAVMQASAVTVVFTVAAGTAWNATNLVNVASTINSIKIDTGTSTGATNLTYAVTDFPGFDATKGWGLINLTNTGYMQLSQYMTNITKTITNFAGLGQTTFPAGSTITNIITISNVLYSYTNYVGATSNAWRRVAVGNVSSNSISTLTGPFSTVFGIGFTNNNIGKDIILTIDYDTSL